MELETKVANELATGAPGTITIGGRAFLVAQPEAPDLGAIGMELRRLAKVRRDAALLAYFREFKDLALAKELVTATLPAADDDLGNFMGEAGTLDGARFVAFILLRKLDPDLSMEQVRQLVTADNAAAVGIELLIACGLGRAVPNSPGANGSPSSAPTPTTTPASA
jgi:hypothetical protein